MPRGSASAPVEVDFRVDASDFRRLLGKSSEVEPKLRAALRKRIRSAAQVAADDAKRAVLQDPETQSANPRHTGLRSGIASGIKVTMVTGGTRAGVMVKSTGSGLPPTQRSLVLAWEARKGWRHPVFGNTERWVTQLGHPYFARTIASHRPAVTAAVQAAMREAIENL